MDEHAHRVNESPERIRYRKAESRDSVAMWRLKRQRGAEVELSPFFYMAVMKRMAQSCIVAEHGGELIGYVIARPSEAGCSVRVVDLVVDPTHDTVDVSAGLLTQLVRQPIHARAQFIEADFDANRSVKRLVEMARSLPLAKCKRPQVCNDKEVVDGAIP